MLGDGLDLDVLQAELARLLGSDDVDLVDLHVASAVLRRDAAAHGRCWWRVRVHEAATTGGATVGSVPKKRRSRRPTSRRSPTPRRAPAREPDLMDDVAEALAGDDPLRLLGFASTLLVALDPGRRRDRKARPGPTREEFTQTLLTVVRPDALALALVLAELSGDELLRSRARAGVADHALPDWVTALDQSHPSGPPLEVAHVLGDGDNVMLGLALPGEHEITVIVYIDHNLGGLVKDAFVVPGSPRELADMLLDVADDPDTTVTELDAADARARVEEAVRLGDITVPPLETDTWPACRALVGWATAMLPSGGTGYVRHEWDEAELREISDRFFASPHAEDLQDDDSRSLLDSLLWFSSGYGPCDPLRWSPTSVELLLLDFLPRKIVAEANYLSKAPDVLRAFVRFCHAERGIRPELTDETLDAVDDDDPEYQEIIRTPRPQGAAALIAAMQAYESDER